MVRWGAICFYFCLSFDAEAGPGIWCACAPAQPKPLGNSYFDRQVRISRSRARDFPQKPAYLRSGRASGRKGSIAFSNGSMAGARF